MKNCIAKLLFAVIVSVCTVFAYAGPNPIVQRLSPQEVAQCQTPASVAYNFVIAALGKDYNRMAPCMSSEFKSNVKNYGISSLWDTFSQEGKLHIFSWKPALTQGYEVAVVYVQDESEYYNEPLYKVYIACVLSSQIGIAGFQDITRYEYETNVKVLVTWENGRWRVEGFK